MTIPTPTPHDAMTAEEFERLRDRMPLEVQLNNLTHDIYIALRTAAANARTLARIREAAEGQVPDGVVNKTLGAYYFEIPGVPFSAEAMSAMRSALQAALRSLLADGEK